MQIGEETKTLQTGEEITVPKKTIHRLMCAGTDTIILEVSTGDFDEKDIVRLEDVTIAEKRLCQPCSLSDRPF